MTGITENIKAFLRKEPLLYGLLQKTYYGCRKVIETHLLGTKLQEWIWKTRRVKKGGRGWAEQNDRCVNHPHRQLLVGKILAYAPLESILEIGCNTGPNLYLLTKKFPKARLYGIDINYKAIEMGKEWLQQVGVKNIVLSAGKADKLGCFHDKSIDLVFTDATLIYIGPDRIKEVIREMRRIARKALVFNEWHQENRKTECLYCYGHWVHNYRALFTSHLSSENSITVSKIPEDLWGGGGWKEFGAIIEVRL